MANAVGASQRRVLSDHLGLCQFAGAGWLYCPGRKETDRFTMMVKISMDVCSPVCFYLTKQLQINAVSDSIGAGLSTCELVYRLILSS